MTENQSKSKVFIETVNDLKGIIQEEGIKPGGKLPSERMLAERLGVGRSSVREALRSMELLGLIQTKHGGGTYLADYRIISSSKYLRNLFCLMKQKAAMCLQRSAF